MKKSKCILNYSQLDDLVENFNNNPISITNNPECFIEMVEDSIYCSYESCKITFDQKKELIRRLNK